MVKIKKLIPKSMSNRKTCPSLLKRSLGLIALFAFFTACSSDDNYNYPNPDELGGFMAFNLITDQPSVGVTLSGNPVGPPMRYRSYTGNYLNIYPGKRSTDAYAGNSRNTLATTTFSYEAGNYYSLFMIGKDDDYENVVVEDHLDSLQAESDKAYVRYFNAVYGENAPAVKITKDTLDLYSGQADYGDISPFLKTETGKIDIAIKNDEKIDTSRTVDLESGKVYTLLFAGDTDEEDSSKTVQIRYIENGIITNDSISEGDSKRTR